MMCAANTQVKSLLAGICILALGKLEAQPEFRVNWLYRVPDSINQVTTSKINGTDPRYEWAWSFEDVYLNRFPYLAQPIQLLIGEPVFSPSVVAIIFKFDREHKELVESYQYIDGSTEVYCRHAIVFVSDEPSSILFELTTGANLIFVRSLEEDCNFMIEDGWADKCVSQLIMFNRFNEIEFISKEELGHLEVLGLD